MLKTLITIVRPGGQTEMVERTGYITEIDRARMIEATAKAGKGKIIHFEEIGEEEVSLKDQRRQLVDAALGLEDDAEAAFEKLYDMDAGRAYAAKAFYRPRIDAAIAKVREFDKLHPEILAAAKAAREERTERNMWN